MPVRLPSPPTSTERSRIAGRITSRCCGISFRLNQQTTRHLLDISRRRAPKHLIHTHHEQSLSQSFRQSFGTSPLRRQSGSAAHDGDREEGRTDVRGWPTVGGVSATASLSSYVVMALTP